MEDENEVIDLGEFTGVKRVSDYRHYSVWRIKRILKQDFGCRLENIWQGYKANRRPNYCERYKVVDNLTGQVLWENVTLRTLRIALARLDYPLKDEKSTAHTQEPGSGSTEY